MTGNATILILLGLSMTFFSSSAAAAQSSAPPDGLRIKNFGWSLRQFEMKKGKGKIKQDKRKAVSTDNQSSLSGQKSVVNPAVDQNPEAKNNQTATPFPSDEETIRVETNLTTNDVLVVDNQSKVVTNLQAKDFIIAEDGVEQKPELVSFGTDAALPRSIVLITYGDFLPSYGYVGANYSGALTLVDKLAPQDKMAIATVNNLRLISDFTSDKARLKQTLTHLPYETNLYNREYGTLMAVLAELFSNQDARPIVIFQTGGGELPGLKSDADAPSMTEETKKMWRKFDTERGYGFSDVTEHIKQSHATIYSIVLGTKYIGLPRDEQIRRARVDTEEWAQIALKTTDPACISMLQDKYQVETVNGSIAAQMAMIQVAKLSGGYTDFLEKPEDAERIYNNIFDVISNRYTIGYYSTNQEKDGKERNVKIQVRDHPEYTLLYKEKYLVR